MSFHDEKVASTMLKIGGRPLKVKRRRPAEIALSWRYGITGDETEIGSPGARLRVSRDRRSHASRQFRSAPRLAQPRFRGNDDVHAAPWRSAAASGFDSAGSA